MLETAKKQNRPHSVEETERIERIKANLVLLNEIMHVDSDANDRFGEVYIPLPDHNFASGGKIKANAAMAKTQFY